MQQFNVGAALREVGVYPGDTVMIHGDAAVAAQYRTIDPSKKVSHLIEEIFQYVGVEGTVVVPAFSYSFTKGEDFDVKSTPSNVGRFSEEFRLSAGVERSNHPIFSVASIGKYSNLFARSRNDDCFGEGTAFDLLMTLDAKIITLGFDIKKGVTFIHYVEQAYGVAYRYMKNFVGRLVCVDEQKMLTTSYYVRDQSIRSECELGLLRDRALIKAKLKVGEVGRLPIMSISARDLFEVANELLNEDRYALIAQRFEQ